MTLPHAIAPEPATTTSTTASTTTAPAGHRPRSGGSDPVARRGSTAPPRRAVPVLRREAVQALRAPALDALDLADGETLSVQDAARLTGVSAHTLRWYERVGLVRDVERGPTGRRRFTAGHLRWIVVLRALRATGMPVATLRELTDKHCANQLRHGQLRDDQLRDEGNGTPADLVRTHRVQVLALMTMLHSGLHVLEHVEQELQARGGAAWVPVREVP